MNIALVAVEYASAFTQTIIKKIFKHEDYLFQSLEKCTSSLVDKVTLNNLQPIEIGGHSTALKLEELRREREVITAEAEKERTKLQEEIDSRCQSRSLSTLSLWLSLYCVIALLAAGLETTFPWIRHFWIALFIVTIGFLVVGWVSGEKEGRKRFFDVSRMSHCLVCFIVIIVVIVLLSLFINESWLPFLWIEGNWDWLLILSAVSPFANFIAFLIISRNKFKGFKQKITKKTDEIQAKCDKHKEAVNKLLAARSLSDDLLPF